MKKSIDKHYRQQLQRLWIVLAIAVLFLFINAVSTIQGWSVPVIWQ